MDNKAPAMDNSNVATEEAMDNSKVATAVNNNMADNSKVAMVDTETKIHASLFSDAQIKTHRELAKVSRVKVENRHPFSKVHPDLIRPTASKN